MPHREANCELDSAGAPDCAAANASVIDKPIQRIVGGYDLRGQLRGLCLKASWFDLILVVYLAGFLRQYFWVVSDNPTAWILTGLFSILLLALVIWNRETPTALGPPRFWLIVGLPLVLMYVIRLPFPDFNYDVLNYHLINSERALRGWPMGPGDFFPGVLLVNPAPDVVDGIFRFALGYRLGTVINLMALLWAAAIINNILRRYVYSETLRYICVLFIVSTEHVMFMLNLYMVDLLALPLMLEATHQILRFDEIRRKDRAMVHIGLLLGLSTAFKLTNLAFVLPLMMIGAKSCFSHRDGIRFRYVVLAGLVFLMPMLPFCLYMYVQTGSPIFPYFNKLFRSPYVEAKNYEVPWLGPKTLMEKVLWPFSSFTSPDRLSPMLVQSRSGYAGRILIGYAVVIGGLMTREARKLCFICLVSFALWIISSGDLRYGNQLELLSGLAIIGVIASVYRHYAQAQKQFRKAAVVVAMFACLLSFETYRAYSNGLTHRELISEASQSDRVVQPTVFGHPDDFARESRFLLNDHSSERFLSPDERHLIDKVDLWINSYEATSGIEAALKPNVPMVSVCDFFGLFDYLKSKQSMDRLTRTLAESPGKRMFSISNRANLSDSMAFIQRVGLKVGDVRDIEVPFFSPSTRLKVVLIEVLRPDSDSVASQSAESNNAKTSNIHE